MIDLTVGSVMTRRVPTIEPEASIVDAADRLRDPEVPALIVCDEAESVVGIVTESDVVAVVAERGGYRSVASFMSAPVETTTTSTPIDRAADRMREAGITILPVVTDDDVAGLLTRDLLAPYLSRRALAVEWAGESLSLDDAATGDALATD